MKKKRILRYTKERVVLSDTLPYETPLIFSNRYFYRFLNKFGVYLNYAPNGSSLIVWNKINNDKGLFAILTILFGLNPQEEKGESSVQLLNNKLMRIPFTYRITHKEKDFRELSVPHPKNQLEIVKFYQDYKELMLYYSSISKYSIRKPDSVAKFIYVSDSMHQKLMGNQGDTIEDSSKEYESLKTFFTYQKYTNLYKFYEDYRYHRAEKKYDKMFKFDISRCFDSIYTHSIVWALNNKELTKDNIVDSGLTFGGKFDKLMQNTNYGETNGILIGPEFSRVFAELILQKLDKDVEQELYSQGIFF